MVIKIRAFNKESDAGFIIDSMAKELYKDKFPDAKNYKKSWFEEAHKEILEILDTTRILIACPDNDHDFLLGYSIAKNESLSFIYVKEIYRRQGIATLLAGHINVDSNAIYMTKIGKQILDQKLAKEARLTNQETPSDTKEASIKSLEKLIKTGFEISVIRFQSAILSGYNTAEFELNKGSGNKQRIPDEMYYTSGGVIIRQNGKWFGTPTANVVSWNI